MARSWIGCVVVGAGLLVGGCEQTVPSAAAGPTKPPANAKFIEPEVTPEEIAQDVFAAKGAEARKAAAAQWANLWIPEPGWGGDIEKVEMKDGSTNLFFRHSANAVMGGGFWVAVEFPGETREFAPAHGVTYVGRIEKVEVLTPSGAPDVRIVVRNGRVLTLDGK